MNTISKKVADGRRRRRTHSAEFKADAVAACTHPGVSIAAVAMARGINANLLRRWVNEAESQPGDQLPARVVKSASLVPASDACFVPLSLPPSTAPEIRIELRRGTTAMTVTWPAEAAAQCAAGMRELLR